MSPLPQGARENVSCAEHTEKNLFSYLPIHLFTFKKAAFTLAEVLITLGIIGVVAALTLPTLIANHQKQTYVAGLKKAYANIQNAFAKMAYDEDVTEWSQTFCFSTDWNEVHEECFNRFKNQFNVVNKGGVWDFFDANGMVYDDRLNFVTSDGVRYLFGCMIPMHIYVDVNGDKAPNKMGRDIFVFSIEPDKNKVLPVGIDDYQTNCTIANINSDSWSARSCTAKVLIEGKMDY